MNNLCAILQHHHDSETLTVKQLAAAARASESTAYRWLGGESEPTYEQIRMLLSRLPAEGAGLMTSINAVQQLLEQIKTRVHRRTLRRVGA